jgi:hypothetical protein
MAIYNDPVMPMHTTLLSVNIDTKNDVFFDLGGQHKGSVEQEWEIPCFLNFRKDFHFQFCCPPSQ